MNQSIEQEVFNSVMRGGGWTFHLIFYRIPINASSSIYQHLGNFNLINKHEKKFRENVTGELYRNNFDSTHAKPNEVFQIFRHEMQNYKSFCVVRNPWERAVSMYEFAVREGLQDLYGITEKTTFERFCGIIHEHRNDDNFIATNKQVQWTKGHYPPQKILRYETLQEDFAEMLQEFGATHISPELPHLNKTEHSHYSDYYNTTTKQIIERVFEKDIDTFKYNFLAH